MVMVTEQDVVFTVRANIKTQNSLLIHTKAEIHYGL